MQRVGEDGEQWEMRRGNRVVNGGVNLCGARMRRREGGVDGRGEFRMRMNWAVGEGDQG